MFATAVPPLVWLRRATPILLAALLLLGLGVRVRHYLAAPSFWYDEAFLLVNVFDKSFAELTGPLRCDQAAPPLFLWSLRGLYLGFGGSEWAMRLPAFLASVVAVFAMIPLARTVSDRGRLWAGGFAAVSPSAIFHTVCAKPYAGDMLATVVIFLAGTWVLLGSTRWRWAAALAAAVVFPWYSYPSIFALAGVSCALLFDAVRRRSWRRGAGSAAVSAAWPASFAAVWLLVGRHQHSNDLAEYWQHGFWNLSSAVAAVKWLVHLLYHIGNYGTMDMGGPLLLLAVAGAVALGRKAPALLIMLLGQLAAAVSASAARMYPLDDRLVFFAVPTVWLLAAAGIGAILPRWRGRWGWAATILLLLAFAPNAVRFGYWAAVVPSKVEFAQAFDYVRRHERPGDRWWVSTPEVYEVYFGKDRSHLVGSGDAVNDRGVWVIAARGAGDPFRDRGFVAGDRKSFKTVEVVLWNPPQYTTNLAGGAGVYHDRYEHE